MTIFSEGGNTLENLRQKRRLGKENDPDKFLNF